MMRAEMWDPVLDAALANNELPPGLPRSDIRLWLGDVTLMGVGLVTRSMMKS